MRVLLGAGLTAGLLSGCKKEPAAAGTPPTTAAQPAAPSAPGATPNLAARPPMPAPPAVAAAATGAVLETMNSGGYTYAKLDLGSEQVWLAGPETKLAVGDKVEMAGGTLMTNFTSNTLNRTFDRIYFVNALPPAGTAGAPAGDPAAAHGGAMPPAMPPAAPTEKIEPIAGGQTIAAVLAAPAPLAGKPVAIRGKVVKFNAQILGHNWLHLQDGTGDLTITTADTAAPVAVGEIVVARGTLAVNKDFGAGYSYPVIVEDATLSAK